jgi:hypothetical protein
VVFLREPGARHGKTLFHVGDMLAWLDTLAKAAKNGTSSIVSDANHPPD